MRRKNAVRVMASTNALLDSLAVGIRCRSVQMARDPRKLPQLVHAAAVHDRPPRVRQTRENATAAGWRGLWPTPRDAGQSQGVETVL